eukprot:GHUV01048776.1.p1 GENE.GHUV01048776.1~~GHUV01048776.1.p1  ORF type:complete len:160 (+),score=32.29 GHUV01048776.1:352-831(+)
MQLRQQQQGTCRRDIRRSHARYQCAIARGPACLPQQPTTTVLRPVARVQAANPPTQAKNGIIASSWKLSATADANVSVQESLLDYICAGPLLAAAGITVDQVKQELPTWEKLGRQLALQLGFNHDSMSGIERSAATKSNRMLFALCCWCYETTVCVFQP